MKERIFGIALIIPAIVFLIFLHGCAGGIKGVCRHDCIGTATILQDAGIFKSIWIGPGRKIEKTEIPNGDGTYHYLKRYVPTGDNHCQTQSIDGSWWHMCDGEAIKAPLDHRFTPKYEWTLEEFFKSQWGNKRRNFL